MRLIKNELKEMREQLIVRELEKINKENGTIAIEVNDLNVYIYATNKSGKAYINIDRKAYKGDTQEPVGIYNEIVIDYKPYADTYKLHLNAYDGWNILFVGEEE